jgi:N-acyl-phosphatidylethanolamine-hydrolysing phospholipase D
VTTSPHFRKGRFHNRYTHDQHGLGQFLKWLPDYLKARHQAINFPVLKPDIAFLKANHGASTITWIGHSSFLVQCDGINLVTDPHLSQRASPFSFTGPKRMTPPAMDFADLPSLDLVLISHNHYDHLDETTVVRLAQEHPKLHFVVPLGLKAWFARRRITQVTELDWWQSAQIGKSTITAVPVQHFSGRGAQDRNQTLWCGLMAEIGGRKIFFAGDTGYSKDFSEIGERFGPVDLAMIPIGAYQPRWFMRAMHIEPEESVRIHLDLQCRQSVAMHWGTFQLTEESPDEPPQKLAAALLGHRVAADKFWVLQHGETRHF